jgi:hypothetical protein
MELYVFGPPDIEHIFRMKSELSEIVKVTSEVIKAVYSDEYYRERFRRYSIDEVYFSQCLEHIILHTKEYSKMDFDDIVKGESHNRSREISLIIGYETEIGRRNLSRNSPSNELSIEIKNNLFGDLFHIKEYVKAFLLNRMRYLKEFGEYKRLMLIEPLLLKLHDQIYGECDRYGIHIFENTDEYMSKVLEIIGTKGIGNRAAELELQIEITIKPLKPKVAVDAMRVNEKDYKSFVDFISKAKKVYWAKFEEILGLESISFLKTWGKPFPQYNNMDSKYHEKFCDYIATLIYELRSLPYIILTESSEFREEFTDKHADARYKRPSIPKGALDSIKPFILPNNVSWNKLIVNFGGEHCQFEIDDDNFNDPPETRHYIEMGFESQRPRRRPIKQWDSVLGKLAAGRGILNYKKEDRFLPQDIDETNKRLKEFFQVEQNLIILDEKNRCYVSLFKIHTRMI